MSTIVQSLTLKIEINFSGNINWHVFNKDENPTEEVTICLVGYLVYKYNPATTYGFALNAFVGHF